MSDTARDTVTATFWGGPLDGEVREIHAGIRDFSVPVPTSFLSAEFHQPKMHIYRPELLSNANGAVRMRYHGVE